jgi:phosphatidylserine/phosphatidylglycerophosphate/cardiolipin synthase-like enzyme
MTKRTLKFLTFFLGLGIVIYLEQLQGKHCQHFEKKTHKADRHPTKTEQTKKAKEIQQTTANQLSKNFGKTHFIVGTSSKEVQEALQPGSSSTQNKSSTEISSDNNNLNEHAYFSPDDGLQKILLDLIANEKTSIRIAIFLFTNGDIAQALISAKEQGVSIEIVTDPSCIQDKFNKMKLLNEVGIPIYVYNPDDTGSLYGNRMHHKFIIFGNNKEGKQLLWFGSFNLTKTADLYNQEAVVLSDNQHLIAQFITQFDLLKKRCLCFKNKNKELANPFGNSLVTAKNRKLHIKKSRAAQATTKNLVI